MEIRWHLLGSTSLVFVCWGLWSFLHAFGVKRLGVYPVAFWSYVSLLGMSLIAAVWFFLLSRPVKFEPATLSVLAANLVGVAGTILWLFALRTYEGSLVVALTATYPVLTAVLGTLLLAERLSWNQVAGIVLTVLGAFLASLRVTPSA